MSSKNNKISWLERLNIIAFTVFLCCVAGAAWWQQVFFELDKGPRILYHVGVYVWLGYLVIWLVSKPVKWIIHYRNLSKTPSKEDKSS